jgi:hypothetical protein
LKSQGLCFPETVDIIIDVHLQPRGDNNVP